MVVTACSVGVGLAGSATQVPEAFLEPELLVKSLYDTVSAPSGATPDWNLVRSHFSPEALIVLRATPEESHLMDLEGFIADFESFYDRIGPSGNGFKETVESIRVLKFGKIAHIYVVYAAEILGDDRPPQRGLDSWHLMHHDGRWWVVSVINDVERIAGPVPEEAFVTD
jgi:hypothetical protein